MGLQIKLIETEEQYNNFKNYYSEIYNLYIMNPNVMDLLSLANNIKAEIIKWEHI